MEYDRGPSHVRIGKLLVDWSNPPPAGAPRFEAATDHLVRAMDPEDGTPERILGRWHFGGYQTRLSARRALFVGWEGRGAPRPLRWRLRSYRWRLAQRLAGSPIQYVPSGRDYEAPAEQVAAGT